MENMMKKVKEVKNEERRMKNEEWRTKNNAIESVSQEGAAKLILITSAPDAWMIEWSNDWIIEWLNDWMIIVNVSGGEHYHFVSCLLEMTKMTKMTKIFLNDPFLLIDISKQNYDSNGIICLKISKEL
jgi:hypothetical protein